ncbi:MAG: helix-turn-helix domain-containing protein [Moorellaceae bacterium]
MGYGQWLKLERIKRGWQQQELAKKLAVSASTLSRYEMETVRVVPEIAALAVEALGVEAGEQYCSFCPVSQAIKKAALQAKKAA